MIIAAVNPKFSIGVWYSLRRYYVDEFYFAQAARLMAGCRVLDIGGHKARKRGRFDISRFPLQVTYANLTTEKLPDIQADAAHLPLGDCTFATVICAEVLEHTPDPRPIVEEAFRVLQPGGVFLATVPFLYRIHADPYDYGRYTDYFWRQTLTATGFAPVVIEKQGAYWSVLADMVRELIYHYQKEGRLPARWIKPAEQVVNRMRGWALQRDAQPGVVSHPFWGSFTTGFGLVATKPAGHQQ